MTTHLVAQITHLFRAAHREDPFERIHRLDDRRTTLLKVLEQGAHDKNDETAIKAKVYLEKVVHHFLQAYPHQNTRVKDIHHFLDLAESDLNEAEKLLNPTA